MKRCPYCAEKILDEAVVCRYCHRDLPPQQNGVSQSNAPAVENKFSRAKNRKKGLVITGGVLVGIIVCCISLYFTAIALINRAIPGAILPNVPKISLWNAGKIYFTEGYNPNLYVMNADGTGQKEIPQNDVTYSSVSVSHDGRQIVFVDDADERDLYIMNADGSSLQKLISNCECSSPVLTPDGMAIIFEHNFSIDVINRDGTNQQELLSHSIVSETPKAPDISHDGKKILFLGDSNPYNNLFVANIDGTGITQFTFDDHVIWSSPVWSPDGKTFAAVKYNPSSPYSSELYLFNSDGSGSKKLAIIPPSGIVWAPSGKWILFADKRMRLINITSGKVYQYPNISNRDLYNLQWAP